MLGPPGFNFCFSFAQGVSKLFGAQGSPLSGSLLNLLSPRFLFIKVVIMIYLFVLSPSSVRRSHFQRSSSLKPLADDSEILFGASIGRTKMAATPI